jgi:small subunit ribosomal protein S18
MTEELKPQPDPHSEGAAPERARTATTPASARRSKRQFFRKKKVCRFCIDRVDFIDYKNVELLQPYIQERGKIVPRRMSGTCSRHQRWLKIAIKRARNIALLPFAAEI